MSNFATLIDWAKTQTEDALGTALQTLGVAPNASAHDEPDQFGAVQVRQLRPGRHESKLRWISQEVVDTLPPGPTKDFAQQQIDIVNGWYNIDQSDTVWAAHDSRGRGIPGVMAMASVDKRTGNPIFPTLALFVAHTNALPDDVVGNGSGFSPGVPSPQHG